MLHRGYGDYAPSTVVGQVRVAPGTAQDAGVLSRVSEMHASMIMLVVELACRSWAHALTATQTTIMLQKPALNSIAVVYILAACRCCSLSWCWSFSLWCQPR